MTVPAHGVDPETTPATPLPPQNPDLSNVDPVVIQTTHACVCKVQVPLQVCLISRV